MAGGKWSRIWPWIRKSKAGRWTGLGWWVDGQAKARPMATSWIWNTKISLIFMAQHTWILGANKLGWSVKKSTILPISCFKNILLSRCMASQENNAWSCTSLQSLKKSLSKFNGSASKNIKETINNLLISKGSNWPKFQVNPQIKKGSEAKRVRWLHSYQWQPRCTEIL